MKTTITALVFAALAIIGAVAMFAQGNVGTLKADCFVCVQGQPITFTGTGFKSTPKNALTLILWDDFTDPITCESAKGGDFTCVVTMTTEPGIYNAVAYSNPNLDQQTKVIGATNLQLVAAP